MGTAAQLSHILVGAVAGRNLLIVPDVVARVLEGRVKAGIDPQGVAAEALHVGQLFGDAGKVADAVSVGVPEALRIDFIKYGVTKPGCRHNNSSVFCFCMDHPTQYRKLPGQGRMTVRGKPSDGFRRKYRGLPPRVVFPLPVRGGSESDKCIIENGGREIKKKRANG